MNDYVQKIKSALLPVKKDREKIQITPYRDWKIIVLTFFTVTILVSGGTFYFPHSLSEGSPVVPEQEISIPMETIDRNALIKTIEIFDGKEARLADLLSKKPSKIDPSR